MPKTREPLVRLYTTGDVCRIFGVCRQTVMRWASNGKIPSENVIRTPGGHLRFYADYIDGIANGTRVS